MRGLMHAIHVMLDAVTWVDGMGVLISGGMDGWMDGSVRGSGDGWMDGWVDAGYKFAAHLRAMNGVC